MKYIIKEKSFDLKLNKSEKVTLILETNKLNINYDLKDGEIDILIFNNTQSDIEINETGTIKNATVKITYLDLNKYNFIQNNKLEVYKDSSLNIHSIYLGVNTKNIKFDITNKESYSSLDIYNNVVALKDSDITLEVIGNIVKGAKSSKCHQASRCLTFEEPKKAKVLPVLNIDECDVEASHSLSSGTIDEEVLFYMNSRGLNKKESLGLLLVSYLLPSEDFYKEFDALDLKEIADKKVEEACLI